MSASAGRFGDVKASRSTAEDLVERLPRNSLPAKSSETSGMRCRPATVIAPRTFSIALRGQTGSMQRTHSFRSSLSGICAPVMTTGSAGRQPRPVDRDVLPRFSSRKESADAV